MTTDPATATALDEERVERFATDLLATFTAGMTTLMVDLADRTGLLEALAAVARSAGEPELARVPVVGADGLHAIGRHMVDIGKLAATTLLPITADRGLCGSFNANVIKAAGSFIIERPDRPVAVGLVPDGLRLRLDAADRAEHDHRAVEHAQRPLDLDGEVDVAGGVDQVDLVLVPLERDRGGRDRDAALALLGHPVGGRLALVDLADLVDLPRVVEEALGDRGLARVDVSDDPDVPHQVDLGHGAVDSTAAVTGDEGGTAGVQGGHEERREQRTEAHREERERLPGDERDVEDRARQVGELGRRALGHADLGRAEPVGHAVQRPFAGGVGVVLDRHRGAADLRHLRVEVRLDDHER